MAAGLRHLETEATSHNDTAGPPRSVSASQVILLVITEAAVDSHIRTADPMSHPTRAFSVWVEGLRCGPDRSGRASCGGDETWPVWTLHPQGIRSRVYWRIVDAVAMPAGGCKPPSNIAGNPINRATGCSSGCNRLEPAANADYTPTTSLERFPFESVVGVAGQTCQVSET